MVQSLTYQHNVHTGSLQSLELGYPVWLQERLQLVLKVFISQQVQAVAAHAAQYTVDNASGEYTMSRVQEGPQCGHQKNQAPAHHASDEGLGVPGEESDRLNRGQIEQAPLDTPVGSPRGSRQDGIVSGLVQIRISPGRAGSHREPLLRRPKTTIVTITPKGRSRTLCLRSGLGLVNLG